MKTRFRILAQRTCGAISAAVAPNCAIPLVGGLEVKIHLANKDDISSMAMTGLVVTGITMKATKKFYTYEGIKTSNNKKAASVPGKYFNLFEHEIEYVVFKIDSATKTEIEAANNGLLVAIVENKYKGTAGNSAFEILGREQGLEMSALTQDSNDGDSQGAYKIILKTGSGGKEGHLPAPFYDTDYATTLAKVTAML